MITLHELKVGMGGELTLLRAEHNLFTFPGGEPHIQLKPHHYRQVAYVTGADPRDYLAASMWADACARKGLPTTLVVPYLPAARADRVTKDGMESFGAEVYAQLINNMLLDEVVTLDPHSPVMPMMVNDLHVVEAVNIMPRRDEFTAILAPDKGAVHRARRVAYAWGLPLYIAEKTRDFKTGKLSGFACEMLPGDKKYLIVDDICDGGGTFMGLADHLRETQHIGWEDLGLWVSHGIFSGGLTHLMSRFAWIGTTDSHPGAITADVFHTKTVKSKFTVVPVRFPLVRSAYYAV